MVRAETGGRAAKDAHVRLPGPQASVDAETSGPQPRQDWTARDWAAAAGLFLATAAVILWQNAHVAVLWDFSYVLDSAARMADGQMPYRDFPFAHAPLTFLIQATMIHLTGRVFWHHALYAAMVGASSTVLTWRIVLRSLGGRVAAAWPLALLLSAPLTVVGIYCILPLPNYDCDCAVSMLAALWLLQRLAGRPGGWRSEGVWHAFAAGAAVCLPVFFKQNMGLPFLLAVLSTLGFLLGISLVSGRRSTTRGKTLESEREVSERDLTSRAEALTEKHEVSGHEFTRAEDAAKEDRASAPEVSAFETPLDTSPRNVEATSILLAVLAGAATTLFTAALLLHVTAGIGNYLHWTIQFAAQRRLPGLSAMIGVYHDANLLWTLPCIALAVCLLRGPAGKARWARTAAFALLAAPFVFTLCSLWLYDDADERGDSLLALWPLLLVLAAAFAVARLLHAGRTANLRILLPFMLLAAIHGTLMSQQLWGSTYALWPLLILLLAELIAFLASCAPRPFVLAFTALVSATLLVCGGFYTASEERLSYAQFPDGPAQHSSFPQLAGMATPGPYLPEFDELLRYASAHIPPNDGLILLPGEDPFYFVTGRTPWFPVLLFDPATDPFSPEQVAEIAQARNIRWLVVKRNLQIREDPTLQREATLRALMAEFAPVAHLRGYDVYRR